MRGRTVIETGAAWRVGNRRTLNFLSDWWVGEKPLGLEMEIDVPNNVGCAKVSDFILSNYTWDFDKLQMLLSEAFVNKVRATPIPMDQHAKDC